MNQRIYALFATLVLSGFVAVTIAYRSLQTSSPPRDIPQIELNDAQKKLLDSRDNMSKWLLGLAYGALVGLLGMAFKQEEGARPMDAGLPLTASGLLILSLYGAFLFQDSMVFTLSKGPVDFIYGSLMDFPLVLQFWTLIGALILLAVWMFRPSKKYTVTLGIFLALGLVRTAQAQVSGCVPSWEKDRGVTLTESSQTTAVDVLRKLAKRAKLKSPSCDYALSLLDELHWAAYVVKQDDSGEAMSAYLKTIDVELTKPGLSTGEIVTKLTALSEVWRTASGLLVVESQLKGMPVLLNGSEAGMTPWQRRLAPGTYSIEVIRGGRTVYSDRGVKIEDGKQWRITVDASK